MPRRNQLWLEVVTIYHFNLLGCQETGGPLKHTYASTNFLYGVPHHVEDKEK